jgi:hypothetical protein
VRLHITFNDLLAPHLIPSVESSPEVGNAFTVSYSDWKAGTYENFKDWALKQFDVKELDSDDEVEVPVQMMKAKDIRFERSETGEFTLPPMSKYKTVRQKQRVVRGYIGAVYRQLIHSVSMIPFLTIITGDFTGSSTSAFPYTLASKDDQEIYSSDCAPKKFCLSDPDHYSAFKINSLYTHWLGRQDKGLQPFIILNANPRHGRFVKKSQKSKGKAKAEYIDVNSEEDEVRSEDEVDPEGNELQQDEHEVELEEGKKEEEEQEEQEEQEEKKEEEGREDNDEDDDDEEQSPPTKYGPPVGKKKPFPLSPVAGTSTLAPRQNVLGKKTKKTSIFKTSANPENIPNFLNWQQKVKRGIDGKKKKDGNIIDTKAISYKLTTTRPLQNANLKKRKQEEDPIIGIPPKLLKTDHPKKSGTLVGAADGPVEDTSSKTGRMGKIETTKKRKRLDEEELTAESSGKAKRMKSGSLKYVPFCQPIRL